MNRGRRLEIADLPAPARRRPRLTPGQVGVVAAACKADVGADPARRHADVAARLRATWPEARVVHDRGDGRRLVAFADVLLAVHDDDSEGRSPSMCGPAFLDLRSHEAGTSEDPLARMAEDAREIAGMAASAWREGERDAWIARAVAVSERRQR